MKIAARPEHLRAAFALFAWPGTTLELALQDSTRAALLHARAALIALREHERTHAPCRHVVRRHIPASNRWITTTHAGARNVPTLIEED